MKAPMKNGYQARKGIFAAAFPAIIIVCAVALVIAAFAGGQLTSYVINDGNDTIKHISYTQDIDTVIAESGVDMDDAWYTYENDSDCVVITIHRNPTIIVHCDGIESIMTVSEGTVASALGEFGITLGEDDRISCSLEDDVYDGMEITINRVEVIYSTVDVSTSFETEYVDDDSLYAGTEIMLSPGADGTEQLTYKSVYVDGQLEDFCLSGSTPLLEPVNEVVKRGTKEPEKAAAVSAPQSASSQTAAKSESTQSSSSDKPSVSAVSQAEAQVDSESKTITTQSGNTYSYSKVINMTATAYTYGSGNLTYSGVPAQVGVVAALPSTIPQGTQVYIVSAYGTWEYGIATVGDVPAHNILDLFMETYDECIQFGVRDALVYVLD